MPASGENDFFSLMIMMMMTETKEVMMKVTLKYPSQYDGSASCVPYTSCGPFGMMLKNLRKPFPNVSKFL